MTFGTARDATAHRGECRARNVGRSVPCRGAALRSWHRSPSRCCRRHARCRQRPSDRAPGVAAPAPASPSAGARAVPIVELRPRSRLPAGASAGLSRCSTDHWPRRLVGRARHGVRSDRLGVISRPKSSCCVPPGRRALFVAGGPAPADGYDWYQVMPIRRWIAPTVGSRRRPGTGRTMARASHRCRVRTSPARRTDDRSSSPRCGGLRLLRRDHEIQLVGDIQCAARRRGLRVFGRALTGLRRSDRYCLSRQGWRDVMELLRRRDSRAFVLPTPAGRALVTGHFDDPQASDVCLWRCDEPPAPRSGRDRAGCRAMFVADRRMARDRMPDDSASRTGPDRCFLTLLSDAALPFRPVELQARGLRAEPGVLSFISNPPTVAIRHRSPSLGEPGPVNNKPTYLSKEGLEKLRAELDEMTSVKRPEVAQRIHDAKEHGDLSENAEYEDAKNEQAFVEGRIQTLQALIKNATIIDENHSTDHVQIGSTVAVESDDGKESFTIVGSTEAKPTEGRITTRARSGAPCSARRRARRSSSRSRPATSPTRSSASVSAAPTPHPRRQPWTGPTSLRPASAGRRSSTTRRRRRGPSTSAACAGRSSSTSSSGPCAHAGSRSRYLYGVDDMDPMDAQALLTPDAVDRRRWAARSPTSRTRPRRPRLVRPPPRPGLHRHLRRARASGRIATTG